jgi:hypothetical protein
MYVLHSRLIWTATLAAALLGIASLSTPVVAQTGSDEGTFTILVDGREVGTEQFAIRQTGSGANIELVATGRVQATLPTGTLELQSRLRATGFDAVAVGYQVDVGGDAPRRVAGTFTGGRATARIATPTGEQLREYLATTGAIVLDDFVAHHYYFLSRRTRSGRVPLILPRENRQVMATITDQGERTVTVAGAPVSLYHLMVQPDGMHARHVYLDALGRVIRVEIPAANYVAVRTELPR